MNGGPQDLATALALMRRGERAPAEVICRQVLAANPDDFGARHLLGVLLLLRGDPAQAQRELAQAIAVNPGVCGAHFNLGNALLALGRPEEAVASYRQALRLKPDMVEAQCNLGRALAALGRHGDAVTAFGAALRSRPDLVEAHVGRGEAWLAQGRHAEALACFDQALARAPGNATALNNRGRALYAMGRIEDALTAFARAADAAPDVAEPHDNQGLALQDLGRFEEAIACHSAAIRCRPDFATAYIRRAMAHRMLGEFEQALVDADHAVRLTPGSAKAHDCRGIVHNDMGRYREAEVDYRKAIELDPGFAQAHNNLGNVLYDMGRMEEALAALQRALDLRPGFPEALSNRGLVLQDTRHFDAALEAYDAAIASRQAYAEAYKRRACLRLLQGDYAQGWRDYETSLDHARRAAGAHRPDIPYWAGEPLDGKSILLSEPNGLGDTIQFWRFMPSLLAMGAQVHFLGPRRMFRLLRTSPWPVRLWSERPPGVHFDYQCELWSLPRLLATTVDTIPGGIPYFKAEADAVERCSQWLDPAAFNIGICWQGNPDRKIDSGRSIPLAAFRPLAEVPGVRLVSLQRNHGLDQLQQLAGEFPVCDPGPAFDGGPDAFVDTAGLMAGLDLVVSSDTAVVHLAGALGRPTWLGVKWIPEWRWMLDRRDSPWYPTVRLFRQSAPGDWSGVFGQMAAELRERVATPGA